MDLVLEKILLIAGYSKEQCSETMVTLNQQINLAILDAVCSALTVEEQNKLIVDFATIDGTNTDVVSLLLANVCKNSVHRLNPDEIADKARVNVIEQFWVGLIGKVTPEQKEAIITAMNLAVSENPNVAKIVDYMSQYQQQA